MNEYAIKSTTFDHSGARQRTPNFGTVQGGTYPDLRAQSAEQIIEVGFDGYALGGLSVGESRAEMYDILGDAAPLLPADRPRYLMGVGAPRDLLAGMAAQEVEHEDGQQAFADRERHLGDGEDAEELCRRGGEAGRTGSCRGRPHRRAG